MKRFGSMFLVLLAIWLVSVDQAHTQVAATPALTVEEARIDLGEIKSGSDAVGTFIFHNSGDEDVKIIRAKPS